MRLMKAIVVLSLVTEAMGFQAKAESFRLALVDFTRPYTRMLLQHYLIESDPAPLRVNGRTPDERGLNTLYTGGKRDNGKFTFNPLKGPPMNEVKVTKIPIEDAVNPLFIHTGDFFTGNYLPAVGASGPVPEIPRENLAWFRDQVRKRNAPDIFLIGGHHVVSEGFENAPETRYLFEPSLFSAANKDEAVRAYFDQVKFAVLWGCNTLTNLEPHYSTGELIPINQMIKFYASGPKGQRVVVGSAREVNSLEFYKNRLATEYGERSKDYFYTRDANREKCDQPGPWACGVTNLERVMPNEGLTDGSRRYNEALKMSQLFRNAYLVLGYSSASPPEEVRAQLLASAVERATKALSLTDRNVIQVIVASATPLAVRKAAIQALREAWEDVSYLGNRGRQSGSITPAFPDLDGGYVMRKIKTKDPQLYGKYR